jgi:hypothetical protein
MAGMSSDVEGEAAHDKGRDGARRAKRWLEATTRANVPWVNPHPVAKKKLTFSWVDPTAHRFSFDLGGMFIGGEVADQEFLVECKNHDNAGNQNGLYNEFLAKCYVALQQRPDRCDNFMWITWSAFATKTWSELTSATRVRGSVLAECRRALGVEASDAESKIDDALCNEVAKKLWVIVLSDRQEKHLVLTAEHQGLIRKHIAEEAAAGND